MLTIQNYVKAASLEEAYELNQKKSNRIIGGMLWLKMSHMRVQTAIDLLSLIHIQMCIRDRYIYYAIPHRLGTPVFFVGGFEGGFALEKTFDYQNPSGYTESYDVYKSTNAGLGSTTVTVK